MRSDASPIHGSAYRGQRVLLQTNSGLKISEENQIVLSRFECKKYLHHTVKPIQTKGKANVPAGFGIPKNATNIVNPQEIKETPRHELEGLLSAYAAHENFHSMDGYDDNDVSQMAKHKPSVRQSYHRYLETRAKYEAMIGKKKKATFGDL